VISLRECHLVFASIQSSCIGSSLLTLHLTCHHAPPSSSICSITGGFYFDWRVVTDTSFSNSSSKANAGSIGDDVTIQESKIAPLNGTFFRSTTHLSILLSFSLHACPPPSSPHVSLSFFSHELPAISPLISQYEPPIVILVRIPFNPHSLPTTITVCANYLCNL